MLDTGRSQQLLEIGGVVVGPRCKSKCYSFSYLQLFYRTTQNKIRDFFMTFMTRGNREFDLNRVVCFHSLLLYKIGYSYDGRV